MKIRLVDKSFAHAHSIGAGPNPWPPVHVEWVRDGSHAPVALFTDECLEEVTRIEADLKVAMLLEPPAVSTRHYKVARKLQKHFDIILTYHQPLLRKRGKFHFYPFGGCWIAREDTRLYPKSKDVSVVASAKQGTYGQKLRHRVVDRYHERIDGLFGTGYKHVDTKLVALSDYRYSIVVENASEPNYFTEKIVDCFATGTVPIYWGCPNIGDFFDERGIIRFKRLGEIEDILSDLGTRDYASRLDAITRNVEKVSHYRTPEDWVYQHILSRLIPE